MRLSSILTSVKTVTECRPSASLSPLFLRKSPDFPAQKTRNPDFPTHLTCSDDYLEQSQLQAPGTQLFVKLETAAPAIRRRRAQSLIMRSLKKRYNIELFKAAYRIKSTFSKKDEEIAKLALKLASLLIDAIKTVFRRKENL